jgi:hypothetical protein
LRPAFLSSSRAIKIIFIWQQVDIASLCIELFQNYLIVFDAFNCFKTARLAISNPVLLKIICEAKELSEDLTQE